MKSHGHASGKLNGKRVRTRAYRLWCNMKGRCNNENMPDYKYYGGRGINVCNEWNDSFESFYGDIGDPPEGMTLDRIDNDKGYYKENCRWATRAEQARNNRQNKEITFNGVTKNIDEWAKYVGISANSLYMRFHRGWNVKRALTENTLFANGG